MQSTWSSLIWKEWHEHKWKLVAITCVLLGASSLAILTDDDQDRFAAALWLMVMCSVPLSIFEGLGAGASERSRNTLPFLQALPVPLWRVAVVKLIAGLGTLVVPIAIAVASFFLWEFVLDAAGVVYDASLSSMKDDQGVPISSYGSWHLFAVVFASVVAGSFFLWSAAASVNRKDEVSAAAVTLAVIVGWWLFVATIIELGMLREHTNKLLYEGPFIATAPGGIAMVVAAALSGGTSFAVSLIVAVIIHAALAARFLWSFGRLANREIRSPQPAAPVSNEANWLGPPRQTALAAIAWKQFRESAPIVGVGVAGTIGVALAMSFVNALQFGNWLQAFQESYVHVGIVIGFLVAIVVGIGVCIGDSTPQLNTFWRSRPIQPDLWFWCKFLVGLGIVLASTYIPLLPVLTTTTNPDISIDNPTLIAVPAAQIATYAAALAVTCLVRHAVYAAILSFPAMYLGVLLFTIVLVVGRLAGLLARHPEHLWELTAMQFAIGCVISIAISTAVAWLAVRNDWGWRVRY